MNNVLDLIWIKGTNGVGANELTAETSKSSTPRLKPDGFF